MKISFILLVLLCFSTVSYAQTEAQTGAEVKEEAEEAEEAKSIEYVNCASYIETSLDLMKMNGKYEQRYKAMTKKRDGFLMEAIDAVKEEKRADPENFLLEQIMQTREEWGEKLLHGDYRTRTQNMVKARETKTYCNDLYIADRIERKQNKLEEDEMVRQKLREQRGAL